VALIVPVITRMPKPKIDATKAGEIQPDADAAAPVE
jgi:hypothetical protein